MATKRVMVSGRVQGVGYRAWCQAEAQKRGLAGWVRNRESGDVEATLHGPGEAVEAMIAALWSGPPGSAVENVDEPGDAIAPEGADFTVEPTA